MQTRKAGLLLDPAFGAMLVLAARETGGNGLLQALHFFAVLAHRNTVLSAHA